MSTKKKQEAVRGRAAAFPILNSDEFYPEHGLTKREYFAAMAMQGILSNSDAMAAMPMGNLIDGMEHVADAAKHAADVLLAVLEARHDG